MSEISKAEQASSPNLTIRPVLPTDVQDLHPVFETWIRDRHTGELLTQEVAELEEEILSSIDGDKQREYFVAENEEGKAIGIMGMQSPPHTDLMPFAATGNPMETINAYVAKEERLSGAGITLAKYIEELATQRGYTELLVNSGPRYKNTGWPFWTKLYGPPAGTAVGFYGPGGDAMVWRKPLGESDGDKPLERAVIRQALGNEETREAMINQLVDIVSHQPKVPLDDPHVKAEGYERNHSQYRNNFFMRFLAIRDVQAGNANEFQEASLRSAMDNGVDLLAFYEAHPELCDKIIAACEAAQPYYAINNGYIELLKLERDGVIEEDGAEVLNTAAQHPLGFEAIGIYYWDRINPLLEEAYGYMEALSDKASELGR